MTPRKRHAAKAAAKVVKAVAPPISAEEAAELKRRAERLKRLETCEREIWNTITPILERHRCRLTVIQTYIDGQPAAPSIRVTSVD